MYGREVGSERAEDSRQPLPLKLLEREPELRAGIAEHRVDAHAMDVQGP